MLLAWTQSLVSPVAEIIPCIFRIMNTSAATARTLQGMVRVRSGQAPAWPLVSDRSVRSGSRVKRDFACTLTGPFPPVLVVLRPQWRLGLEGRTRTLSGPSPDLTLPCQFCPGTRHGVLVSRFFAATKCRVGRVCDGVAVNAVTADGTA